LDGIDTGDNASAVISRAEVWHDVVSRNPFRHRIGQQAFKAVTDFETKLSVFDRNDQDDSVVEAFLTDLPILSDADTKAFDVFAVECRDRKYRDLMAGISLKLSELDFQRLSLIGLHHAGVVIHPAA
jgi:hypothetical protein